jgi:excisionase family DNA binding protein
MDEDPLIPLTKAAEKAGISRSTLRRYIDDGRIQPHHRTAGGHIRFRAGLLICELDAAAQARRGQYS